jgi:hypothetical protein
MATWNIVNGRGWRLKQAAPGLAQMGIGVAGLTETKFVNDWYPNTAVGYTIMSSKVASCSQGGVALAWRENDLKFKVKLVLFHGPYMLTFQLMTRDEQIYVVGTYIPPKLHEGGGGYSQRSGGVPGGVQTACHGGPEHQPQVPSGQVGGGHCQPAQQAVSG